MTEKKAELDRNIKYTKLKGSGEQRREKQQPVPSPVLGPKQLSPQSFRKGVSSNFHASVRGANDALRQVPQQLQNIPWGAIGSTAGNAIGQGVTSHRPALQLRPA